MYLKRNMRKIKRSYGTLNPRPLEREIREGGGNLNFLTKNFVVVYNWLATNSS